MCAHFEGIRDSGVLTQEADVNSEQSPGAEDIFRIDTAAILQPTLLVACLDQETIDCGVACEIGIAFAFGIPVLGLYTDVRQFRRGAGKMYKNLYVIGAIEAQGTIFSNLAALKSHLENIFIPSTVRAQKRRSILIEEHFSQVAGVYSQFVDELESWYQPSWSLGAQVSNWVREAAANSVLEHGCGSGAVARQLSREHVGLGYLGFDTSAEMVKAARSHHDGPTPPFTCNRDELLSNPNFGAFDMALALFSLHDDLDKMASVGLLAKGVRHGGMIRLLDLSDSDLPRLTGMLRSCLARPAVCLDHRLSSRWARDAALQLGLDLAEIRVETPKIVSLLRKHSIPTLGFSAYIVVWTCHWHCVIPRHLKREQ